MSSLSAQNVGRALSEPAGKIYNEQESGATHTGAQGLGRPREPHASVGAYPSQVILTYSKRETQTWYVVVITSGVWIA